MAAPSGVVVLENDGDEDRVPTEEEVNEYAEFLGIDPKTEPHLMWIASEGVKAPVPAPWKACTENGDDVFYFNFDTGESVWDHPSDAKYRILVDEHRARGPDGSESPKSCKSDGDDAPQEEAPSEDAGSPASDKAALPKARGGLLEPIGDVDSKLPSPAKELPALNLGGAVGLNAGSDQKRLQPIISEISDEDNSSQLSPRSEGSQLSPQNNAMDSPAAAAAALSTPGDRGSAGVGLAPAGGRAVNTSLDKSEDRSMDSSQDSPQGASQSQSQSGPSTRRQGNGKNSSGGSDAKLGVLERSGQSAKSSNLSEVSEDFPSDFEQSDHALSPHLPGSRKSFGDSLEISATIDDGLGSPERLISVTISDAGGGDVNTSGADKQEEESSPTNRSQLPPSSRMSKLQGDVASLGRVLAKLREIRGQQREYLQLLQGGC